MLSGVFCRIEVEPENTLVDRCQGGGPSASMNCSSNESPNSIAWTYDGNTVISEPCMNNTEVFLGDPSNSTGKICGIRAYMDEAYNDTTIRYISGPYGCTDQTNDGVTQTAMVIVLGTSFRVLHSPTVTVLVPVGPRIFSFDVYN